ncbi:ParB/RepB/Spo0J family partition protein [Kitasatospora sp. NPDC057542]|uniref:ParB/RepB/Spo0J family partition protein n=1 Tax=Kitasatospora sp. NPDC057542 TaxID=3346162 RepID=UPI0036757F50
MSRRVNLADMLDGEPLDEPTHAAPRPPIVGIEEIAPNPGNPRGQIDETDQEFLDLAGSIETVGVITPLTLCSASAFLKHNPEYAPQVGGRLYVVVAGHRRLAAAVRAGLREVPAYVNDEAAPDPLVWAVAENLLRVALNPIQEAEALRILTDPPPKGRGMAQTKAAKGIGKTQGFVSQRIALLNLVPELQAKVASGELGLKAARAFVAQPKDNQLAAYSASVNPVEDRVDNAPQNKSAGPSPSTPQPRAAEPAGAAQLPRPSAKPSTTSPAEGYYPVMDDEAPAAVGAQQVSAPATALASATLPEPREPLASPDPLDVDWHDVTAFATAITEVLDKREAYALAEALIENLRD